MQVRVQRAAAALAQRKANARAAAEQAEQAGLGGNGGRSKHQPSSSFTSMSRDQVGMGHALIACLPCRVRMHYVLLAGE